MEENKTNTCTTVQYQYARERYYRAVVYHPACFTCNETHPGGYPWYIYTRYVRTPEKECKRRAKRKRKNMKKRKEKKGKDHHTTQEALSIIVTDGAGSGRVTGHDP